MANSKLFALTLGAALVLGCDDGGAEDGHDDVDAAPGDAGAADAGLDAAAHDGSEPPADAGLQSVTIRFKAKVGDEDLVCGQTYDGLGTTNASAKPRDFRFFVQELRLIDSEGKEVPVTFDQRLPHQTRDIALIDFTDGADTCTSGAPTTNMVITGTVPPGTYQGVVFVNGVSESLNHGNPAVAPEPLQAPGAHWTWNSGYRFMMAELLPVNAHDGTTDAGIDAGHHADATLDAGVGHDAGDAGQDDAGSAPHGGSNGVVFVHSGSTACSGTPAMGISCSKENRAEIRLSNFDPASQSIVADLGAVFAGIDLSAGGQCHGSGAFCAPFYSALGIDFDTGAPASTQTVYRVE